MTGRALFRFDASPEIGGGHAYRCLTLADAMTDAGWEVAMATGPDTCATVPAVSAYPGVDFGDSGQDEAAAIGARVGKADLLVVDHYGIDATFERAARRWAQRVLAIDDLADRVHDSDYLLDQTPGRKAKDYAGLVPDRCTVLTGAAYALLRPAFLVARKDALARRASTKVIRRMLISVGATDPVGVTLPALRAAARILPAAEIDVVLGRTSSHLAAVKHEAEAIGRRARVHLDTPHMAELIAGADLAIGGAGGGAWERCVLGLPTLVIIAAPNQRRNAAALARLGAAHVMDEATTVSEGDIAHQLAIVAGDPTALAAMSRAAAETVDGRGAQRVMLALAGRTLGGDGAEIKLRLADADDEAMILDWQRHPTTRRFARNPRPPEPAEHSCWMSARLADPHSSLMVIQRNGEAAGMLRLDRRPGARLSYEISILIAPAHQRQGVAKAALLLAVHLMPGRDLVAEVLPGNVASQNLFLAAGFETEKNGWLIRRGERSVPLVADLSMSLNAQPKT